MDMNDETKCTLKIFYYESKKSFRVQLSCTESKGGFHYKDYKYDEIDGIVMDINREFFEGNNKALIYYGVRDNINIPISMKKKNDIVKYIGADFSLLGGSRRRSRRPSRKYKKSAKRVFRKKSRSTRRR